MKLCMCFPIRLIFHDVGDRTVCIFTLVFFYIFIRRTKRIKIINSVVNYLHKEYQTYKIETYYGLAEKLFFYIYIFLRNYISQKIALV